jgi:tetratricopeptide (TPR) repeat protein
LVFLLRSFSINYLVHRAPDFFDWRSGVFELPTTPEVVEKESSRLLDEADYEEYLQLSLEKKIEKVLEIQELITEKHQTKNRRAILLFQRGKLLLAAKDYKAAIASYDEAVKIKPDLYEVWNNRGLALSYLGRYEAAIVSYDEAVKIKPDLHEVWNNRGLALSYLVQYEAAIASYDEAVKIKPDLPLSLEQQRYCAV